LLIGLILTLFSNFLFGELLVESEIIPSVSIFVVPRIVVCPHAELEMSKIKNVFIVLGLIVLKMIGAKVLQIGDGRAFQHKFLFGALKFLLPQNCQAETQLRLLGRCCYGAFLFSFSMEI
jgi:hypothetical protein